MAEKILIIDDDLDTLRLVGLMLQKQGYQIAAAGANTNTSVAGCWKRTIFITRCAEAPKPVSPSRPPGARLASRSDR